VRGGDRFEVLGDGGCGVVDPTRPLTDRPIQYWAGLPTKQGHLLDGHLSGLHLDNVVPDGHLIGRHLHAEHLWPADVLEFVTPSLYFGEFAFTVGNVDAVGNKDSGLSDPVTRVVNSSPRPSVILVKSHFDSTTRRLVFGFERSPDL
jgi:hypothetical protein